MLADASFHERIVGRALTHALAHAQRARDFKFIRGLVAAVKALLYIKVLVLDKEGAGRDASERSRLIDVEPATTLTYTLLVLLEFSLVTLFHAHLETCVQIFHAQDGTG